MTKYQSLEKCFSCAERHFGEEGGTHYYESVV